MPSQENFERFNAKFCILSISEKGKIYCVFWHILHKLNVL